MQTTKPYHATLTRPELLEAGRRWFAAAVEHEAADELLGAMLASIRGARPESIRPLSQLEPTEQPQAAPPTGGGR